MKEVNSIGKWEEMRAKGKARYIFLQGFVKFGLILFLSLGIATPLVVSGFNTFYSPTFYLHTIALLVVVSLGSTMHGLSMWEENERKYNEAIQSGSSTRNIKVGKSV